VHVPGMAYVIAADDFREAVLRSPEVTALVIDYIEMSWAEAQQLAACNAAHDSARRLARWLLQCADRIGSEPLPLTQESISEMLGVRRTTVTVLAQDLQAEGIIKYARGAITIADRAALEFRACDCYRAFKELYRGSPAGSFALPWPGKPARQTP